jgi:phosphatidylglycerophosphate synthase
MVISRARDRIDRVSGKVARVPEALGLSPTTLTFLSLGTAAVAGALLAYGYLVVGAAVGLFSIILDILDGALARRTGNVSPFGGFLDSLFDRYADGFLIFGIAWYYAPTVDWIWPVAYLAFLGAFATSYARARTYQAADPPAQAWADLVERTERMTFVLAGSALQGAVNLAGGDLVFLPWVLVLLAVLGNLTVIQRSLRARGFIREGDRG